MPPLKLFFQLPYKALGWRAELELIKRFEIVSRRLGHQFFAGPSIRDAKEADVDYIFTLHHECAKVSRHFTVNLAWNPIDYLRRAGNHTFIKTLSHDGLLYGAESLRQHFGALASRGYQARDLGNFYPSAEKTDFAPVENFGLPTYIGALWQKGRHHQLFAALNDAKLIHGYGPVTGWSQFANIYRGAFAMDGRSYETVYRRTGVGLCLHSEQHLEEGIPAMRIFEVVASGCVAICDEHPFVREHFGDSVYYVDTCKTPREIVAQITAIVETIRSHPGEAREKAARAHSIFNETLCLDHLLATALGTMEAVRERGYANHSIPGPRPSVGVITRTAGTRPALLRRALRSLAGQSWGAVRSTIVYHGSAPESFAAAELPLLRSEFPKLVMDFVSVPAEQTVGQALAAGLQGSQDDFVGILDDDDWYYPEHLETMAEALRAAPQAALALSGAALEWEWALNAETAIPVNSYARDCSELLSFEPMTPEHFVAGRMNLCSGMMLFRRSRLPQDLSALARLNIAEERGLVALVMRPDSAWCVFSSRVSCSWAYRHLQADNHIDAMAKAQLPHLPAGILYKGLNLPYLEPNGNKGNSHLSPSLAEKCRAARRVLRRNRWLPRALRPLTYQQKLKGTFVSTLQELLDAGVIHKSDEPKVVRMGQAIPQAEFNQIMKEIIPGGFSESDLKGPQHELNLRFADEVDRLSRSF